MQSILLAFAFKIKDNISIKMMFVNAAINYSLKHLWDI